MTEQDKDWIIANVVNPIVNALNRHTSILESLAENIGRSTAKWLELANLPSVRGELQEDAFSELGFKPAEIADIGKNTDTGANISPKRTLTKGTCCKMRIWWY